MFFNFDVPSQYSYSFKCFMRSAFVEGFSRRVTLPLHTVCAYSIHDIWLTVKVGLYLKFWHKSQINQWQCGIGCIRDFGFEQLNSCLWCIRTCTYLAFHHFSTFHVPQMYCCLIVYRAHISHNNSTRFIYNIDELAFT